MNRWTGWLGGAVLVLDQLIATLYPTNQPVARWPIPWQGEMPWLGAVLILLLLWWRKPRQTDVLLFLTCGLTSNALSFVRFGHVVDYLPLGPAQTNGADVVICLGIGLALYQEAKRFTSRQSAS